MMKGLWSLGFLLSMGMMSCALTPSSFLSTVDKDRLHKVFAASLNKEDVSGFAYAVLGFDKLQGDLTSPDLCKKLQMFADSPDCNVANAYHVATAAKVLPGCKVVLGPKASQVVSAAAGSDGSVANLYYAVMAQTALGQSVDKSNVAKLLSAALKMDDSVSNLGYAFNLAAVLNSEDVKSVFERIEDAVVQADEVDRKMLQFEGGISVTNLVVNGAYKLAEKMGKAPPISKMQSVKFANYFLTRKSVQQPKGAFHLLESLTTLASNKFHVPVSVTLATAEAKVVSESSPKVQVQVTDLLGNSLGKMEVSIESAMRVSDGHALLAKTKMTNVAESTYEVDVMGAKPGRGFYELTINAAPVGKADDRLVGNTGAVLTVKVTSQVTLEDVELSIGDVDKSTAVKTHKIQYPSKLGSSLEADHHHKISLKFSVKDKSTKEKVSVHQAFVSMVNVKTGAEIVFITEAGAGQVYEFVLDVNARMKDLASVSGKYQLKLMIGDAVVANPISWTLAEVNINFPADPMAPAKGPKSAEIKEGPQPDLRHTFREPEKRPPAVVSNAFTVLCLVPFAVLFAAWAKLGVNLSGFPLSMGSLGFHAGLGGIFGLYYYFWLSMNMFSTMKYLIMIGVVTFLCGNSMLSKIADKRKA